LKPPDTGPVLNEKGVEDAGFKTSCGSELLASTVFGMNELFCCPRAEKDGAGVVPKSGGAGAVSDGEGAEKVV
jgi:hypothetical protein